MKFSLSKFFLLLLVVFIVPLYPIYAEESTSSTTINSTTTIPSPAPVEKRRQKLEKTIEKLASQEAMLKDKLAKFKDQKKAERVERFNALLEEINKRRTAELSRHVSKLDEILKRLEDRSKEASSKGGITLTNQTDEAITNAREMVASASAAVSAQTQKSYTITITSESTAKSDAKVARDKMHSDLKLVHNQVVAARKAVANAIRLVAQNLEGIK